MNHNLSRIVDVEISLLCLLRIFVIIRLVHILPHHLME